MAVVLNGKWRCQKHPSYKAYRPPRSNCPDCTVLYALKNSIDFSVKKVTMKKENKRD